MKNLCLTICLVLLGTHVNAQVWKTVRHEVSFGVGASNFLGDLGGSKGIGTHGIKDLRFSMTRPTISAGYKYMLHPKLSVRSTLIWSLLSGDDADTKNEVRNTRNLSFRSNIGEVAGYLVYYPIEDRVLPRYKIQGIRGNKTTSISPYIYLGIGATFFNPKANYEGTWYALQPLATEGQGLAGRPDKYHRVTVCFPIGAGLKYRIDKQLSVSFELSLRYTLSDYIDDVSTSYYLPDELVANYGEMSGILSDRSNSLDFGVKEHLDGRNNYLQRGNPRYNDAYMFGILSFHYRFKKGQVFIPKF